MLRIYLVPSLMLAGCFSYSVQGTPTQGQIKIENELEHGRGYKEDTVNVMGYVYKVAKDKTCCEECKNLYKDTEYFQLSSETMPDFFYKRCGCIKSKPGVVPSTQEMSSMSGNCGLWEYNGDGDLGKEGIMIAIGRTHFLGLINNVSDASYCCDTCMNKFPDTQLFGFFKEGKEKYCQCYKTRNDEVPAILERVQAIGTCYHRQGSDSDGPIDVATEDLEAWDAFQAADIDSDGFLDFEEFKELIEILKSNHARKMERIGQKPEFGNLTPELITFVYSYWANKDGDHKLSWNEAKQFAR